MNGDGRLDVFVAGYTDQNAMIPTSSAGFPANHRRPRPALPERGRPHAAFREVGAQAGLEPRHVDHGLGAVFTDVNRDGRLDLYVANDLDPNRLYLNVAKPNDPRAARVPVRRARTAPRRRRPERRHGRRRRRLLGDGPAGPARHELARQLHAAYEGSRERSCSPTRGPPSRGRSGTRARAGAPRGPTSTSTATSSSPWRTGRSP